MGEYGLDWSCPTLVMADKDALVNAGHLRRAAGEEGLEYPVWDGVATTFDSWQKGWKRIAREKFLGSKARWQQVATLLKCVPSEKSEHYKSRAMDCEDDPGLFAEIWSTVRPRLDGWSSREQRVVEWKSDKLSASSNGVVLSTNWRAFFENWVRKGQKIVQPPLSQSEWHHQLLQAINLQPEFRKELTAFVNMRGIFLSTQPPSSLGQIGEQVALIMEENHKNEQCVPMQPPSDKPAGSGVNPPKIPVRVVSEKLKVHFQDSSGHWPCLVPDCKYENHQYRSKCNRCQSPHCSQVRCTDGSCPQEGCVTGRRELPGGKGKGTVTPQVCYICGVVGHYAPSCPNKGQKGGGGSWRGKGTSPSSYHTGGPSQTGFGPASHSTSGSPSPQTKTPFNGELPSYPQGAPQPLAPQGPPPGMAANPAVSEGAPSKEPRPAPVK